MTTYIVSSDYYRINVSSMKCIFFRLDNNCENVSLAKDPCNQDKDCLLIIFFCCCLLENINESYYKLFMIFAAFLHLSKIRGVRTLAHTHKRAEHCTRLLPEFIWLVRSWRADVWRARPNAPDALRVSHISGSVGSPQLPSVCRRCSILWSCSRDPRGTSVWISVGHHVHPVQPEVCAPVRGLRACCVRADCLLRREAVYSW